MAIAMIAAQHSSIEKYMFLLCITVWQRASLVIIMRHLHVTYFARHAIISTDISLFTVNDPILVLVSNVLEDDLLQFNGLNNCGLF